VARAAGIAASNGDGGPGRVVLVEAGRVEGPGPRYIAAGLIGVIRAAPVGARPDRLECGEALRFPSKPQVEGLQVMAGRTHLVSTGHGAAAALTHLSMCELLNRRSAHLKPFTRILVVRRPLDLLRHVRYRSIIPKQLVFQVDRPLAGSARTVRRVALWMKVLPDKDGLHSRCESGFCANFSHVITCRVLSWRARF